MIYLSLIKHKSSSSSKQLMGCISHAQSSSRKAHIKLKGSRGATSRQKRATRSPVLAAQSRNRTHSASFFDLSSSAFRFSF
jgi:hypothetical protein